MTENELRLRLIAAGVELLNNILEEDMSTEEILDKAVKDFHELAVKAGVTGDA